VASCGAIGSRAEIKAPAVIQFCFFRPCRGLSRGGWRDPGLTPWATFCRPLRGSTGEEVGSRYAFGCACFEVQVPRLPFGKLRIGARDDGKAVTYGRAVVVLARTFSARLNRLLKNSPMMSFRSPALLAGLRNLLCFQQREIKTDSSLRSE